MEKNEFLEELVENGKTGSTIKAKRQVKAIGKETFITLAAIALLFGYIGHVMGAAQMFATMMATGFDVLINTSFFIMALAIIAGALSALMSEFGVTALINKIISPLMRPLFGLPGAAALGAVTCWLSDNPAILANAADDGFDKYFTKAEKSAYTTLGTTFGMGLIVTAFMLAFGEDYFAAVLIGNICAFLGGIVAVRLMIRYAKKYYHEDKKSRIVTNGKVQEKRTIRDGGSFERFMKSIMDGAKAGVELGLACASGTVLICTFVMILTFGPSDAGIYTGAAYEGVRLLPMLGEIIAPVSNLLWGFQSPELIAFPITALGSVGAARGLSAQFVAQGIAGPSTICVFTAMGICLSGFLSTHIGMLDTLKQDHFVKPAILYQLIGGACAGVFANYIYILLQVAGVLS